MAANNFDETMTALFKGMDGFITSKTVVGDAIKFEDGTTILPLVDVSFGAGAGAFASESKKKDNGVGAMSGKITPSSVLVIKNGNVKLVNIKKPGYHYQAIRYDSRSFREILKNAEKG